MKKIIITLASFFLFCLFMLSINLRGNWGNPTIDSIRAETSKQGSAFESSLSRGRYAQTMALVEDKRADLVNGKEFIPMPDLGVVNGKAYPLFAPGLAFYSIPAYVVGSYLGAAQLSVFFFIAVCAAVSAVLISITAISLGTSQTKAMFGGLTYLFATTAFPYAVTLAQHNVTVMMLFLILLAGIHGRKYAWFYSIGWLAYGLAIFMDYPNLILLAPAVAYMCSQALSLKQKVPQHVSIKLHLSLIYASMAFAIVSLMHGYYNSNHFGSPITVGPAVYTRAQTLEELNTLRLLGSQAPVEARNVATTLFDWGKIANGMQVLLVSKGRGVIYYAPIVLIGLFGIFQLFKSNSSPRFAVTIVGLILVDLVLYSSFGDPWGGWEFGPRYLIPSFSVLSVGISILLTKYKNILAYMFTLILFAYSSFVNLLGTLTTNQLPAEIEAIPLGLAYTYEYNFERLLEGMNSSITYKTWLANSISSVEYFALMFSLIVASAFVLLGYEHIQAMYRSLKMINLARFNPKHALETLNPMTRKGIRS